MVYHICFPSLSFSLCLYPSLPPSLHFLLEVPFCLCFKVLWLWRIQASYLHRVLHFMSVWYFQDDVQSQFSWGMYQRSEVPSFLVPHIGRHLAFFHSVFHLQLLLIIWVGFCLPGFSTVKFLFFVLQLWAEILR